MVDLKECRLKKCKTQKEVADEIGIRTSYYCMIENGKYVPSPKIVKRLAKYFRFSYMKFYQ